MYVHISIHKVSTVRYAYVAPPYIATECSWVALVAARCGQLVYDDVYKQYSHRSRRTTIVYIRTHCVEFVPLCVVLSFAPIIGSVTWPSKKRHIGILYTAGQRLQLRPTSTVSRKASTSSDSVGGDNILVLVLYNRPCLESREFF